MSGSNRLRLMPVVITAAGALLVLKLAGFATHTSTLFVPPAHAESAPAKPEAAAEGHGEAKEGGEAKAAEGGHGAPAISDDHGMKEETKPGSSEDKAAAKKERAAGDVPDAVRDEASSSEKALLEALKKRRETLDTRASDLDMRESLLAAAQKKLEDRLDELKRIEKTIADADDRKAEEEKARLKNLVVMYEAMKVKEAARIFEKLDPAVLLDVAGAMAPRKLSDILGQMNPDAAQKLTVSLARRQVGVPVAEALAASDLPKIEGRPSR